MDENNLVYEYEKYYMDSLCKSKNLLFSRAEEIALHKIFFKQLKKKMEKDTKLKQRLRNKGDVLDDICRFGKDHFKPEWDNLCARVVDEWIRTVTKKDDACPRE